jgi:hypothetical protein
VKLDAEVAAELKALRKLKTSRCSSLARMEFRACLDFLSPSIDSNWCSTARSGSDLSGGL